MLIGGIQKLSLLDYPGKTCCTLFTAGCNCRCPFCHNGSLVEGPPMNLLPVEEVLAFLKKRRGLLDGVCITGGEPLLQKGLKDFARQVKALGFLVKLDTNGSQPDKLRQLIHGNLLDYVAMDIKNTPDKYPQTVGIADCDPAPFQESVALLLSGLVDYEFRTTVVRQLHSREDLLSIARWIKGARAYFLQSFTDSGEVLVPGLSGYSKEEMLSLLESVSLILPSARLRGI